MVYSTGDLLQPRQTNAGAVPGPRVPVDVGCLATSPQFTGPLMGTSGFALSKVIRGIFNKLNLECFQPRPVALRRPIHVKLRP